MVRVVDERGVKLAINERKTYIQDNANTLSLKALRALLEEDMKIPKHTLKAFKQYIEDMVLKIVETDGEEEQGDAEHQEDGGDSDMENVKPKKKQSSKRKSKPERREVVKREDGEAHQPRIKSESKKSKVKQEKKSKVDKALKRKVEEDKPRKKQKVVEADTAPKSSGAQKHSRRVRSLLDICKRTTIKVSPSLYKIRDDTEMAAKLEELLDKHDLNARSGAREISRAKAALQTARDLEGIDTSNIMEGGRTARRTAAPAVDYKALMGAGSSSDSENDSQADDDDASGSDDESDDAAMTAADRDKGDANSNEEAGGQAKQGKPQVKHRKSKHANDCHAEEQSDSAEAEEAGPLQSESDQDASQPQAYTSPGKKGSRVRKRQAILEESDEDDEDVDPARSAGKSDTDAHRHRCSPAGQPMQSEQHSEGEGAGAEAEAEAAPRQGDSAAGDSHDDASNGEPGVKDLKLTGSEKAHEPVKTSDQPDNGSLESESGSESDVPVKAAKKQRTVLDESSEED